MRANSIRNVMLALVSLGLLAGVGRAETIATFADPTISGDPPLFELDDLAGTLNGGWSNPGLELIMPCTSKTYPDATFEMTELTWIQPYVSLTGGTLKFHDNTNALVLQIEFDGAVYHGAGFGASVLTLNQVTITGPSLPANLEDAAFAFAFANPKVNGNRHTWSASFTSSAIPEPGSLLLLAGSPILLFRRTR